MNIAGGNLNSSAQSRRAFIKCAGIAAVGLGLPGDTTPNRERKTESNPSTRPDVRVRVQAPADPLIARTFAILKDRIEQRCAVKVVEARNREQISLTIDNHLPPQAFRIDQSGGAVRVAGDSPRGLLYGVGKFL